MSFLDRIDVCAQFEPASYLPFRVDGVHVGFVRPEFATRLASFPDVFETSAAGVALAPGLVGRETRTAAVAGALRRLASDGAFAGWREEPYAVAPEMEAKPFFVMERAAIPKFGIRASGVHVNGWVRRPDGIHMWIGRRSPDKQTSPDKLDQIVAGGRSALHSVFETVVKEAGEEAGIGASLAGQARPVGAITYTTEREEGLRRDVLYVFDLELPPDFVPVNHDGEIAEFQLWPIDRVLETVRDTENFKFNCALVVIDFLIRHGLIAADGTPDYLRLVEGLRSGF